MKKTAHIIYPSDKKKDFNPWSIGNNIGEAIKSKFNIKFYSWQSTEKIKPEIGDILIGHAHTNPYTILRRSFENNNWAKRILIQPYNEDPYQVSHLYNLVPDCDHFLALCGNFWYKRVSKSPFKKWKKKMTPLKIGVSKKNFPFIKKKFNPPGKRKFIFIGNDYAYNNFAKNTLYLEQISNIVGLDKFFSIGNYQIGEIDYFGWLDLSLKKNFKIINKADFLIQTSTNDANPSTVIESMCWGLIPVLTKECGYDDLKKTTFTIPLQNIKKVKKILNTLQYIDEKKLKNIQKKNLYIIDKNYNWVQFRNKVQQACFNKSKKIYGTVIYTKKEKNFFLYNLKKSPNYYKKIGIILQIIKSNLKRVFF